MALPDRPVLRCLATTIGAPQLKEVDLMGPDRRHIVDTILEQTEYLRKTSIDGSAPQSITFVPSRACHDAFQELFSTTVDESKKDLKIATMVRRLNATYEIRGDGTTILLMLAQDRVGHALTTSFKEANMGMPRLFICPPGSEVTISASLLRSVTILLSGRIVGRTPNFPISLKSWAASLTLWGGNQQ